MEVKRGIPLYIGIDNIITINNIKRKIIKILNITFFLKKYLIIYFCSSSTFLDPIQFSLSYSLFSIFSVPIFHFRPPFYPFPYVCLSSPTFLSHFVFSFYLLLLMPSCSLSNRIRDITLTAQPDVVCQTIISRSVWRGLSTNILSG